MKKVILLNSPAGSGKDYAADYITNKFDQAKKDKFARVLKERTHALYGYAWRPHDYYEAVKEIPTEDFFGLTPRQAYINVSEVYFKPVHGKDIFGKILSKELDKYDWDIIVISDSGFVEEAEVLINKYGSENVILIKVIRPGYSFKGDSRNYIELNPNICNITITNDGTETYLKIIDSIVTDIVNNES